MDQKKVISVTPTTENAGGGYEGAQRTNRELFRWNPAIISPNNQIAAEKELGDARSQDMVQNDGMVRGAVASHRDSIVGARYVLNAKPNWKALKAYGADETWAEEYQEVVENRFNLLADSPENWLDAAGDNTLTGLVRLAVASFVMTGEVLSSSEWLRQNNRPCKTAIQALSPARLSNPDGQMDTETVKSGIHQDRRARALGYYIRMSYPNDMTVLNNYRWKYVPAAKPWGRKQIIHIKESLFPDQARGVAEMVSALKNMKMTKNFQEVSLQNAVIQASYAAAIESELPSEVVYGQLGMGQKSFADILQDYMMGIADYAAGAKNISIDGARIPHLFPGTKLNMKPLGSPGGVGSDFESSLLRHTAAALGLSYEQFARDYTKTNYSSARASNAETDKFMRSRKKHVADTYAWNIYALWLEEEIARGDVPLPPRMKRDGFYKPLVKDALCQSEWIGASKGQIDEKKETEAAIMRVKGGLSTYESEIARLGSDWREVFAQRAREEKLIDNLKLQFSDTAKGSRPGENQQQGSDDTEGNEDE